MDDRAPRGINSSMAEDEDLDEDSNWKFIEKTLYQINEKTNFF